MTERHFLVATSGPSVQRRVMAVVRGGGGFVLLATASGALIARMADRVRDEVAAMPGVGHVGAVEVSPRPIRRIRVGPEGRRVPN